MSGMFAVSKPPMTSTLGLRRSQASVIEKNGFTVCDDLMRRHRRRCLPEVAQHEHCDVVAPRHTAVEKNAVQHRRRGRLDVALLRELADQRVDHSLAGLDPAARQVPAAHVAVLHQKHAVRLVDDEATHAERHAALEAPISVEAAPDRWLEEGNQVSVGELTFDILYCPGHSPGSVVFFNQDMRFAHVGDVLFNGSVGRTDLPRGSHDDLIRSIKTKILPLGDQFTFLCGHGPGSTVGEERQSNPFLV